MSNSTERDDVFGMLSMGLLVGVIAFVGWRWPSAGGTLLITAGVLLAFLLYWAVGASKSWNESDPGWTVGDYMSVALGCGVPVLAGVLFLASSGMHGRGDEGPS